MKIYELTQLMWYLPIDMQRFFLDMLPLSNAFLGKQMISVLGFALNSSGAGSATVAAQPLPAWWCQKDVYW